MKRTRGRHLATTARRLSRGWAVPLALVISMTMGSLAFADILQNNVVAGGNDTITAGQTTTITYSLQVQGQGVDGEGGCNATAASPAVVTLTVPAGVSASTSQLTFIACGPQGQKQVTFGANTAGSYPIDVTSIVDTGPGTYLNQANFTLKVNPVPVSDSTPPVIDATVLGDVGNDGWYTSDVSVTWAVGDPESTVTSTSDCGPTLIDADTSGTTMTCSATSEGGPASHSVTIKRDATKPTIGGSASPSPNANGWNNGDVTVSFTCSDAMSGIATCSSDTTLSGEGAGQSVEGHAVDAAGNTASATVGGINIDKTAPTIEWVGGPADGSEMPFGSVPPAPTCVGADTLSGIDGACVVTGHSSAVGTYTMYASVIDAAGNTGVSTRTYTVLPWVIDGFYRPVEMTPGIYNTIKGGSTVPLKFEVFAGGVELTATSSITGFAATRVTCQSAAPEDPVDFTTAGGTTLRYDWTAGQFIQNWQTPKGAGLCYRVTVTAADGSSVATLFKTK